MTNRQPLVSLVLTTLNSERYLARSIASCLGQTHAELELLIVDGGSSDRTLDIVHATGDPRVRVIHQPGNAGKLPGAINLGLAEARGELLTWSQSDCWYEANALETMVTFLDQHPEVDHVYTDYWEVDEAGQPINYRPAGPVDDFLVADVVGVCFLFRRAVYVAIGPQAVEYYPVHDVPWRIRAARQFRFQPLHIPLLYYVYHPDSLTVQTGRWNVQRLMAHMLVQEGLLTQAAYQRRLGKIALDEAYDAIILHGDFLRFWQTLFRGALHDWGILNNTGLWRLMLSSLLPDRTKRQRALLTSWRAAERLREVHQTNQRETANDDVVAIH
jgi:glycosyltransferase involved in cell wall biosynthesis